MTAVADVLEQRARWHVEHAPWQKVLKRLPDLSIDVAIADPPYSEHVHTRVRQGASLPDTAEHHCRFARKAELGFDHITQAEMRAVARQWARLVRRWVLVFCDVESVHLWRAALQRAGLEPVRVGAWVKLGGTPQFSGDRPAVGFEAIVVAHRKGRKRWNGGGHPAVWSVPIEANRLGNRGARVHTAQKPEDLLVRLVELFSDPGEVVLDTHAGASTTGVAALRRGRRFLGIECQERYAATSRERLAAEEQGLTLAAARAGQLPMPFGAAS
ncbi:MAG: site-specific DNA-methyltransferase [Polyangiaceae bacterium]